MKEFLMPTWPTLYPLYLTYKTDNAKTFKPTYLDLNHKRLNNFLIDRSANKNLKNSDLFYRFQYNITDQKLQMLYECEEERHIFKACLRELISLKRTDKHTSWKTADISSLYLA